MILPTLFLSLLATPACTRSNRILLVFAPTPDDPRYTRQLTLLADGKPALAERDVLVTTDVFGQPPPATQPCTLPDARKRFSIPPGDFTVLLLGKDGGQKLRRHTPLTIEDLNSTIDSMPMRKEEMKK